MLAPYAHAWGIVATCAAPLRGLACWIGCSPKHSVSSLPPSLLTTYPPYLFAVRFPHFHYFTVTTLAFFQPSSTVVSHHSYIDLDPLDRRLTLISIQWLSAVAGSSVSPDHSFLPHLCCGTISQHIPSLPRTTSPNVSLMSTDTFDLPHSLIVLLYFNFRLPGTLEWVRCTCRPWAF